MTTSPFLLPFLPQNMNTELAARLESTTRDLDEARDALRRLNDELQASDLSKRMHESEESKLRDSVERERLQALAANRQLVDLQQSAGVLRDDRSRLEQTLREERQAREDFQGRFVEKQGQLAKERQARQKWAQARLALLTQFQVREGERGLCVCCRYVQRVYSRFASLHLLASVSSSPRFPALLSPSYRTITPPHYVTNSPPPHLTTSFRLSCTLACSLRPHYVLASSSLYRRKRRTCNGPSTRRTLAPSQTPPVCPPPSPNFHSLAYKTDHCGRRAPKH